MATKKIVSLTELLARSQAGYGVVLLSWGQANFRKDRNEPTLPTSQLSHWCSSAPSPSARVRARSPTQLRTRPRRRPSCAPVPSRTPSPRPTAPRLTRRPDLPRRLPRRRRDHRLHDQATPIGEPGGPGPGLRVRDRLATGTSSRTTTSSTRRTRCRSSSGTATPTRLPSSAPTRRPTSAVIKVDAPSSVLHPIPFGDSNQRAGRRPRRRDRQPVRPRGDRDERHRQRAPPPDGGAEQLHDQRLDPDRRRDQPRQLRRPAAQRRAARSIGVNSQIARRLGRQRRHRVRDPVRHRQVDRGHADLAAARSSTPTSASPSRRSPRSVAGQLGSSGASRSRRCRPNTPAEKAGPDGATGQKTVDGQQYPTGGDVITAIDGQKVDDVRGRPAGDRRPPPGRHDQDHVLAQRREPRPSTSSSRRARRRSPRNEAASRHVPGPGPGTCPFLRSFLDRSQVSLSRG